MTVRVESDGAAAIVTIDRPETKNSIDRATAIALADAVRAASSDDRVRGVVLTGAGEDTFASGGDVNELRALLEGGRGGEAATDAAEYFAALEDADVPIVAAMQGGAYGGGCELVLLCDLVVAEAHAGFAFRHARMGLTPAWGGLTRLLERAGPIEAARLLYTADFVDASAALRVGLVNEVVPRGSARRRAVELVERIAENPRGAVAAMKRALAAVRDAQRGDALAVERATFLERWGSPEHRDAMSSFFDRIGRRRRPSA